MSAGILSQISFIRESAWGTAGVPDKSLAIKSGGIETKEDIKLIPAIRGQLPKNYSYIKGKISHEGSYTFNCFADYAGYFLLSAIGQDSAALKAGETLVYTHTFTEGTNAVKPSFTIEQAITEDVRRFAGCICHEIKISGKTGETVDMEASFMGKTFATATEISGAFTTVPSFNHTQVQIKLGSTVITECESFEFDFKNNLEMVYALGNAEPSFNVPGGSEATIKCDLYLDSTTLTRLTNYLAGTAESAEIIITGGSIGTASNYVLDILLPNVAYTTGTNKVTDKANLLSIEGAAYYSQASGYQLQAQLTNLLANYTT